MKKLLVIAAASALLAGCGSIDEEKPGASAGTEQHAHDHDHDHDHDHGHDHSHDHDHGEHIELGSASAAGVSFEAVQLGYIHGGELAVEIIVAEGSPAPKAIRVWIGEESGQGSMKTRAEGTGPAYDMHLEAIEPLPEGAKLWVEIENAAGERGAASFDVKLDAE